MASRGSQVWMAAVLMAGAACSTARADEMSALSARIAAAEYEISSQPEGYAAPNRAQGFRTTFTEQGIHAVPRTETDPSWDWGLAWIGYGRGDRTAAVPPATLAPYGNRIEYRRGPHTEWYENGPAGLKQGFLLAAPPEGDPGEGLLHLDLALMGSLSPAISDDGQAIDFVSGTGMRIVRYAELRVTDGAGREVPAWMEAFVRDGVRGIRLVLDAGDAVFPLLVDPLATTPAWTKESDQGLAEFGRTVATAGDVNGDGFSDLLVAAPFFDAGHTDEGRVFLFLGSSAGLSAAPAWTAEGDQTNARFGIGLATAGDVNGDGFSDVIVGAPLYNGGRGRVFVYLGAPGGLAATPVWTVEGDQASARLGTSVGTAGDVNGDGFSDVIAGAPLYDAPEIDEGRAFVYLGSASGPAAAPTWTAEGDQAGAQFGWSVATAGDADCDGRADVVVGAPLYDNVQTDEGRAYFYVGTPSGVAASTTWITESDQAGAQFGWSVATAGDVNGNGCADILVGAWRYSNGQSLEGRAYVFLGGPLGPSHLPIWTGEGERAEANFGFSVSTAGDVDGDGFADIVVAAPFYFLDATTGGGQAYVYRGSLGGVSATPTWNVMRSLANAAYGYTVATAGDVNGDGYGDVVVGAPWDDNPQTNEGLVYAYLGSVGGLSAAPSWSEGNQAAAHLGECVASAGDVNGDGYADLLVGAPGYDNGMQNAGKAYLWLGSPTSLNPSGWSLEGSQEDEQLGIALASAGDVNGDGYGDVLVGTPFHDANAGEDAGKAELYLGSPTGLSPTPAWTKEGGGFLFYLGYSLGTAGDVNGDGFGDVIVGVPHDSQGTAGGSALVFLGSPSGLPATQDWALGSGQPDALGFSVGTAGDVNRDGYSDILVGAPAFDGGQVDEGRAFLFLGGPGGLAGSAAWTIESNVAISFLGSSIAAAGDVNGDAFADVIVGVPGGTGSPPHARIYLGSGTGLSPTPASTLLGSAWGAHVFSNFGISVASAGDVNGDGFADVLIGSPFHNVFGTQIIGHAFVALGSPTGVSPSFFFNGSDGQDGTEYGRSVAPAGDLDGDGYADIAVGAPLNTHGETQEGRAFVHKGNGGSILGGLALNPRQRRGDDSAPVARLGSSGAPDLLRLAVLGRTPFGRGRVKLEWEVRRFGTALAGVPTGSDSFTSDTGVDGAALGTTVPGLLPSTLYHWRVRLRYDPASVPFASRSRWFTVPWGGRNEAMLRMGATTAGAGAAKDLIIAKSGAQITLFWKASCVATDGDYEVYEGTLGSFTSHVPVLCTTAGNMTATFAPGPLLNRYYLVVPHNGTSEGSYGTGVGGAERAASASACKVRQVAACP